MSEAVHARCPIATLHANGQRRPRLTVFKRDDVPDLLLHISPEARFAEAMKAHRSSPEAAAR